MACVRGSVSLLVTHFEFVQGLERSTALSAALLSDWQSLDFIDFFFFTALCQNIQLQTLKTSAIARHLQPYVAPLIMVDSCPLFFEGGGKEDKPREWKMIGEHNLRPQQRSLFFLCISLSLAFHSDTEKILYTD